jgi:hypothetical protein
LGGSTPRHGASRQPGQPVDEVHDDVAVMNGLRLCVRTMGASACLST